MIGNRHLDGAFHVRCDFCCEQEIVDTAGDFDAASSKLKEMGWRVFRVGKAWDHECPNCTQAFPFDEGLIGAAQKSTVNLEA